MINYCKYIAFIGTLILLIGCSINKKTYSAEQDYRAEKAKYSELIRLNPKDYRAYLNRGIFIYNEADKWKNIKEFEKVYPVNSHQLATLLYLIDTNKTDDALEKQPEFQDLKCFFFAFKQMLWDFEKAGEINPYESEKTFKYFCLKNPIILKMTQAFFGTKK